jgi:hypothetical protein
MAKTLQFHKVLTPAGQYTLAPANAECEEFIGKAPATVYLKPLTNAKQRSLSQNALMWKWYDEIARFQGVSVDHAHRFSKLHHGVPILRRDSEDFRKIYDAHIKPHEYVAKLEMIGLVDVTSALNTAQCTELCETLISYWGEQGLSLTIPDQMFD